MEQRKTGLFEEFDESGGRSDTSDLAGRVVIRHACLQDADAVGRISAEREGGDAQEHADGVRRTLESDGAGENLLTLVAALDDEIIGFGKARYISGENRPDADVSPEGWYLTGVVVDPRFRRQGVGSALTLERLRWIAERSDSAYYFANVRNRVSIALHQEFGFVEVARGGAFAGVSFVGGEGILFRADLGRLARRAP